MALNRCSFTITAEYAGRRMDHALADLLPPYLGRPVSRAAVRRLIIAGAVYLNGTRTRIASKVLRPGARIEAHVDPERLAQSTVKAHSEFEVRAKDILYEDAHLIAVFKPSGLPTQQTLDNARAHLYGTLKRFLSKRDAIAEPYLGLHHRLDGDTSGVILFTKTRDANPGVAALFKEHLIEKTYRALVLKSDPRMVLPAQWSVVNHLGPIKAPHSKSKRTLFGAVRSGGDPAHTDFTVLEDQGDRALIEAKPRTGRTHQIRVHLAEMGLPILGDRLYMPEAKRNSAQAQRLLLHALELKFIHPLTGRELVIRTPDDSIDGALKHSAPSTRLVPSNAIRATNT